MNKNNDNQIDNPTNGRTFNWINEISPTDNTYKESSINNENKKPSRKYVFATAFFTIGLVVVSIVKNETRKLQTEINDLLAKRNSIELELYRTNLDYEVITSPQNISRLANEFLDKSYFTYNKSQIKSLNEQLNYNQKKLETRIVEKNKKQIITSKVAKKIEEKKNELYVLKKKLSEPKKLPSELKIKIAKKIKVTKHELEKLYQDPKGTIESKRAQNWAIFQLAKVFLGFPVVPGK